MVRLLGLCALLVLGFGAPVFGQVTLERALAKVLAEHPQLQAARARLRAAEEEVRIAAGKRWPAVDARTGLFYQRLEGGRSPLVALEQELSLRQLLYDGGRSGAALKAARARLAEERARLRLLEQELLVEAVAAFTAVLRDQRLLELALLNEQRLLDHLAAFKARYREGQSTGMAVARAEARYREARAARLLAQARLEESGARFRRAIGDPPGGLVWPALPPGLPPDLAAALAAVEDHPRVRAAEFAREAALAEVQQARAGLRPLVLLESRLSWRSRPDPATGADLDLKAGALLTLPLYRGGALRAAVRQSRARELARRYARDAARRAVQEEIRSAFFAFRAERERWADLSRRERAVRMLVDGLRNAVRMGQKAPSDLLEGERELFQARSQAVEARRARLLAAYRLLAAMGRLGAAELGIGAGDDHPTAIARERGEASPAAVNPPLTEAR